MNRTAILISIGILCIFGAIALYFTKEKPSSQIIDECSLDSECVPNTGCHPTSCIHEAHKNDSQPSFCTMECRPNTLDCNQGSCRCVKKRCTAILK